MYNVDCSFGFGMYKVQLYVKGSAHSKKPFSCFSLLFLTAALGCRHDLNQTFGLGSHMELNINFVTYVTSYHSFFTLQRVMMSLEKHKSSWKLVPVITFFFFFFTCRITISRNPHPPPSPNKISYVEKLQPGKGKKNGNKIINKVNFLLT